MRFTAQIVQKIDTGDQAQKGITIDDDRHMAAFEYRQQGLDRRMHIELMQIANHRGGNRVAKPRLVRLHMQEQVRLVQNADDFLIFDHRQLRDIIELHPTIRRSERLLGPDYHGITQGIGAHQ
ncbi:hypothetical protein RF55_26182 [Lasius niger]|uniref:Uncharacterized protein n=1 Tax=Lasius niger TaxID=67767 RepID=A0A0J7JTF0_LASNI|nr:hypothetical protein RF55_26182 [Lasius niger]